MYSIHSVPISTTTLLSYARQHHQPVTSYKPSSYDTEPIIPIPQVYPTDAWSVLPFPHPRMTSRVLSVGAPIVAAVAVVTTLITCVAIAKSDDIYVGGLAWPYFSDMGRGGGLLLSAAACTSFAQCLIVYGSLQTRLRTRSSAQVSASQPSLWASRGSSTTDCTSACSRTTLTTASRRCSSGRT